MENLLNNSLPDNEIKATNLSNEIIYLKSGIDTERKQGIAFVYQLIELVEVLEMQNCRKAFTDLCWVNIDRGFRKFKND